MKLNIGKALALALPLLVSFQAARADTLSVTLQQNVQMVLEGTLKVSFFADITNQTSDTIFLNGDNPSVPSPFTLNDIPFFSNAPISLAPGGDSGLFEIFDIDLDPSTPVGDYVFNNGFEILGGADGGSFSDFSDLADVTFTVDVEAPTQSTVPEPGTLLLLASGLGMLLVISYQFSVRRRWQHSALGIQHSANYQPPNGA